MNLLSVKNLSKKYPAFELKEVSFNVKQGSIMGFIGKNGAGKPDCVKTQSLVGDSVPKPLGKG